MPLYAQRFDVALNAQRLPTRQSSVQISDDSQSDKNRLDPQVQSYFAPALLPLEYGIAQTVPPAYREFVDEENAMVLMKGGGAQLPSVAGDVTRTQSYVIRRHGF